MLLSIVHPTLLFQQVVADHGIFFFQAEDGIRDHCVTGVQTCALPISTVREGSALYAAESNEPSLTVGLVPRSLIAANERFTRRIHDGCPIAIHRKPKSESVWCLDCSIGDRKSVV